LGTTVLTYEVALSQAAAKAEYPRASFDGPGASGNSVAFGVDTSHPFTPQFPVLNGVNIYDPAAYALSGMSFQNDHTFERDVVGDVALDKPYSLHSHYGSFDLGFKAWDARKTQLYDESFFSPNNNVPMSQFLRNFSNHNYYFGRYTAGPITNYNQILAYFNNNPGAFTGGFEPGRSFPNDFDISERIWAGYVMNTIGFGKLRLQTGVRVEATRDDLHGNVFCPTPDPSTCPSTVSPLLRSNNYTDVLPSVQAQYRLTSDTVLRAAYGMGIARPNFGDQAPYVIYDRNANANQRVTAGNPDLKPTHAQNFDLLAEHYLKPIGLIQVGGFYKYLTDPIYFVTSLRTVQPFAGQGQLAPINGPNAHIAGVEMAWQQQLRFLPGLLNGMGVRANYSYANSRASFPFGFGRSDHPTLLRTAPNNWNFDVTYDKRGISARMGLTHNDANVWSYGFQDGAQGGIRGPLGDTYLYPHTQVDAQVSYWIPRGRGLQAIVSLLNLNNEVFGFYNGSEQYPIQREYYNRTISLGLRWTLLPEPK
jgi:TonB-dependent receptor